MSCIMIPQLNYIQRCIMTNNGFLKLDNAIIDYWMSRLSHSEFKTLLAIYRKTIGWGKQYDRISQNQISDMTGITTRSVRTAITSLEGLKLIITTGKNKSVKMFTLNTETLFNVCLKPDEVLEMESKLEIISKEQGYQCNNDDINSYDDDEKFLHKRHSKDTNKIKVKETVNINIPFSDFWDKYDYCKGKKSDVEAKWNALTDEDRTLTMESLDTYLLSTPDKTYRKYPMSYLNTEAWNDEHVVPSERISNTPMATTSTSQHSSNNVYSSTTYSASFKPFEDNSSKHTKDELESNLEALGISSGIVTGTKDVHNNNTDIVAKSSQVHWSELKARGLLKSNKNPTAIAPNTSKSKEIDNFLSKFGSKSKYSNKNIISGNSVIDNGVIDNKSCIS